MNIAAIRERATTAHQQYEWRSRSIVRLKDPTDVVASKTFYKSNYVPYEPERTFGKPMIPSTPIKGIIENHFGDLAEQMTLSRYDNFRNQSVRTLSSHKKHTRASSLQKTFTNEKQHETIQLLSKPLELFKMNKFKQVAPRTNTNLVKKQTRPDIPLPKMPSKN